MNMSMQNAQITVSDESLVCGVIKGRYFAGDISLRLGVVGHANEAQWICGGVSVFMMLK